MAKRIVIVDDDLEIIRMLRLHLEDEGYRVFPGYDGQMALQLARTMQPDLIILDVDMPLTNGIKALEFLRKLPETKHIPIIFLTGVPSGNIFPYIATAPRVAHLKKPVDFDDLHSVIREFVPSDHSDA